MNDIAERTDLNRFADDGCPYFSGETQTFDLQEVWGSPDDDLGRLLRVAVQIGRRRLSEAPMPRSRGLRLHRPCVCLTVK